MNHKYTGNKIPSSPITPIFVANCRAMFHMHSLLYHLSEKVHTGRFVSASEYLQAPNEPSLGYLVGPTGQPAWYFIYYFILFSGMAVAQFYFGSLIKSSFTSAIRFNITVNRYKDNSQVQRQIDNILYTNYFLSLGFFLFFLETTLGLHPFGLQGPLLLLLNVAFLFVFFLFRIVLLNLVGHLFNRLALFREYNYHAFTYNKLLGLIMLPLGFISVYTSQNLQTILIYISAAVILLIVTLKILRGISFSLKRHVFSFYLFLYLCALEMVPILLIYKWITRIL